MQNLLILIVLFVAIAIGWLLGRLSKPSKGDDAAEAPPALSRDYLASLNYLLNEHSDRSLDSFVETLEVSSDTIDTHITLGNLFRMRGEADRAARLHQNLLARPALNDRQNDQVQLELARDFMHLGVLDRAENLLRPLVDTSQHSDIRGASRELLIQLYEQEREWQQALDLVPSSLLARQEELRCAAAHWHCELAEQDFRRHDDRAARRHLKKALSIDAQCVRAYWLQAEHYHRQQRYRDEIKMLERLAAQSPDFAPIIIERAIAAFRLLDDEQGLMRFLDDQIHATHSMEAVIKRAELGVAREGITTVAAQLDALQQQQPHLRGIGFLALLRSRQAMLELSAPNNERAANMLRQLHDHLQRLDAHTPRFRCEKCGTLYTHLYWHCPKCKRWATIKPRDSVDPVVAQRETPAQRVLKTPSTSR
ncbi:lipopolysaccharide assembly protein LapB [Zymobacter sp. IVIA_12111.31 C1]|uniref:lipopolysaccharide assembly protein LapB n=1 Tax=Zymobacter sp. IVIA_12111.31 C1 TaxID=3394854 RepID=UPI0039C1854A